MKGSRDNVHAVHHLRVCYEEIIISSEIPKGQNQALRKLCVCGWVLCIVLRCKNNLVSACKLQLPLCLV